MALPFRHGGPAAASPATQTAAAIRDVPEQGDEPKLDDQKSRSEPGVGFPFEPQTATGSGNQAAGMILPLVPRATADMVPRILPNNRSRRESGMTAVGPQIGTPDAISRDTGSRGNPTGPGLEPFTPVSPPQISSQYPDHQRAPSTTVTTAPQWWLLSIEFRPPDRPAGHWHKAPFARTG